VQSWLGHASLRTTAVYRDVLGADERAFAAQDVEIEVGWMFFGRRARVLIGLADFDLSADREQL
jgi:hypothetical protein